MLCHVTAPPQPPPVPFKKSSYSKYLRPIPLGAETPKSVSTMITAYESKSAGTVTFISVLDTVVNVAAVDPNFTLFTFTKF
ncbi:hypothetical protein D3C85_1723300 [compost metagenome]